MSRKKIIVAVMGWLAAVLAGCDGGAEYRTVEGYVWGTTYHITYKSDRNMSDSIESVMQQVNMSLSPFQEGSLVSRLNAGETVVADRMLADVITLSQQVCALSGGVFDPTVAPLINLWGFGYKDGDRQPTQEQIDSALASVGILDCAILADGTVQKKSPDTEFNFSAIAKGYGVDRIAEMLRRNGCRDYMVEVGGEIALAGKNRRGEDWHVQIDAPVEDEGAVEHHRMMVLPLTDCCLATSGNYRNYRDGADGNRYGHTISTRTGMPAQTDMLSATIIADNCALADALATASMAMPADSAEALLGRLEVRWVIVSPLPASPYRGKGAIRVRQGGGQGGQASSLRWGSAG